VTKLNSSSPLANGLFGQLGIDYAPIVVVDFPMPSHSVDFPMPSHSVDFPMSSHSDAAKRSGSADGLACPSRPPAEGFIV
jgi:hypothetical protein